VLARVAAVCGLVAPLTTAIGWAAGGLAQPDAYSSADHDISDLGAVTASSAWIYNQVGANLTGLLVIVFALGLWRALSPDTLGRAGAGVLVVLGVSVFFNGLFRLDCQAIDTGCVNDSWQSEAHRIQSRVTVAGTFIAPSSSPLPSDDSRNGGIPGFRRSRRSPQPSPPVFSFRH
jgi:hypothetical protein